MDPPVDSFGTYPQANTPTSTLSGPTLKVSSMVATPAGSVAVVVVLP